MLHHDHVDDGEHHETGDRDSERPEPLQLLAELLGVDVEHHDHEQEEHHDRADVDEHEHDAQKLGVEQQPDDRAVEEAQHQEQRTMHGIAREYHAERGTYQHRG